MTRAPLIVATLLVVCTQLALAQSITDTFTDNPADRWQPFHGDWSFAEGTARQASADYDCGATFDAQPDQPYYLAVRFKPLGAFNGAGVFFGLAARDGKHSSMMVRCDPGGRILWGAFDAAGNFDYFGDARITDPGDSEQTLAVAVDPAKLAFNIYHNNTLVQKNVKANRTVGYVGLQTSGGPHEFREFTLRPATNDELTGIRTPGRYSRFVDFIGNKRSLIALRQAPRFLVRYDEEGEPTQHAVWTEIAGLGARDLAPIAVCWDRHRAWDTPGGVYVLAENGQAIYQFNAILEQVGNGPLLRNADMRATDLAVGPQGNLYVTDPTVPGVRVFSKEGQPLFTYGEKGKGHRYDAIDESWSGKFEQPSGLAFAPDGTLVITDKANLAYQVYTPELDNNTLTWTLNGPWLPHPAAVDFNQQGDLLLAGTFEYYRSHGALRVLNVNGYPRNVYCGFALNDMSDKLTACQGPGGKYYLADRTRERIVILPPNFVEQMPAFAWTADGKLQLTLTNTDGSKQTATSSTPDPEDADRLQVRPSKAPTETWPPINPDDLRAYSLPRKPPAGQRYVIDMPVLVAVFTNAIDQDGKEHKIDPAGIQARIAREMLVDRQFYWLNSHAILNKQFEIMVIDDVVAKIDGAWISPTEGRLRVNEARAKRGLPKIDANHSLVCIHPMPGFDPDLTDDMGYVGGGGLTPFAYSGYALWNNGQSWLMAHEWGHQLDAYFEASGMTNWWLNHPDWTVHVGRYGEHWDCNAFLCRRADPMNWLRFKFGNLRLSTDADNDGLVDDDPRVMIDEQRFHSSPQKKDTDGDGLSDLAELTAGTFTPADPQSGDTDRDGTPDAEDAYPQFAVDTSLPKSSASTNEMLIRRIREDWCAVDVYGGYTAQGLYLMCNFQKPIREVHATVDFDNDGWFTGRDNVYATVNLDWSGGPKNVQIARSSNCRAQVGFGTVLELLVEHPSHHRPLRAGDELGLTLRFQNGNGTVKFLIDPWQILAVQLQ
jgi:hypothetical protein